MTIGLPAKFIDFAKRLAGLQPGRFMIILSVYEKHVDFTVQRIGPIEK